jgi:hypothetical protein
MIWSNASRLAVLATAVAAAPGAKAEFGVQTSLARTDNIDRTENDGRSERILSATIGGQAGQAYRDLERRLGWDVAAISYLDDTFDDEVVASLDGAADFALVERRLSWHVEDQLGLQSMNVFGPSTPESREHVNYFTTGPELELPIASSVAFVAQVHLGDVWYEEQPLGNSRTSRQIGFDFGFGPRRSLGLFTSRQDYRFDDELLNPNYERRQTFLQFDTTRRRGTLRAAAGTSELHGLGDPQDGFMAEVDWQRTVSEYGTFGFFLQRGFSDAGESFQLNQSIGGGTATSRYVAGVSNPMERSHAAVRFAVTKPRTSSSISYTFTREDYVGLDDALNRDVPFLDLSFSRAFSPRLRLEIRGSYSEQQSIDTDTQDRERRVILGLAWTLGRRADVSFQVARFERSSSILGSAYEENRAFVTFSYGAEISGIQMGL